jgi:hypothetical protein
MCVKMYCRSYYAEAGDCAEAPLTFLGLLDLDNVPIEHEKGLMEAARYWVHDISSKDELIQIAEKLRKKVHTKTPSKNRSATRVDLLTLRLIFELFKDLPQSEAVIPDIDKLCTYINRYADNTDLFKTHQVICQAM